MREDMNPAILNSQFVQVALPIMITFAIAAWINGKSIDGVGKRIDDLRSEMSHRFEEIDRRFDEVFKRFDGIDTLLREHDQKIVRLEERTSPLTRR
jgi:hypothetical protein